MHIYKNICIECNGGVCLTFKTNVSCKKDITPDFQNNPRLIKIKNGTKLRQLLYAIYTYIPHFQQFLSFLYL